VPIVPGYHGKDQTPARLLDEAERIAPDSAGVPLSRGILEHYYGWNFARMEQFCRLAIERHHPWHMSVEPENQSPRGAGVDQPQAQPFRALDRDVGTQRAVDANRGAAGLVEFLSTNKFL